VPLERYDKFFGGEKGSAGKALKAMKRTYGSKDGEHVFYARIAKEKRRGRGLFRGGKR